MVGVFRFLLDVGPLPGPAHEGRCSTGQGHDPGEGDTHDGVVLAEAEVAHRFAHHHVSFNGQDHQRPQGNLTCKIVSAQLPSHLHPALSGANPRALGWAGLGHGTEAGKGPSSRTNTLREGA